jgi:hypothetical protein
LVGFDVSIVEHPGSINRNFSALVVHNSNFRLIKSKEMRHAGHRARMEK